MWSGARLGLAAVTLVAVVAVAAWASRPGSGAMRFTADVPADVRELATRTRHNVAAALPARAVCLRGVRVDARRVMGDRARYDPAAATVTLRIPATAAQLEAAVIHELAHHIEHTCPSHHELRGAFLAAQGQSDDRPWFGGDRWEDIPSEQYAEAVVQHVRGGRSFNRQLHIKPAAMAALAAWAVAAPSERRPSVP